MYKCPFHLTVGSKLCMAFALCLSSFSHCEQVTGEQEDSLIPEGSLRGLSLVCDWGFSICILLKNKAAPGEPPGLLCCVRTTMKDGYSWVYARVTRGVLCMHMCKSEDIYMCVYVCGVNREQGYTLNFVLSCFHCVEHMISHWVWNLPENPLCISPYQVYNAWHSPEFKLLQYLFLVFSTFTDWTTSPGPCFRLLSSGKAYTHSVT